MATVHLSLPELDGTAELATDQVAQGVNTSTDENDWGAGIIILVVVLCIAAVAVGIFGFRSNARKKERLEDRDAARGSGADRH